MAELEEIVNELKAQTELIKEAHKHDEELFNMRKEEYDRRALQDLELIERDREFLILRKKEFLLNKCEYELHLVDLGLSKDEKFKIPE